MKDYRLDVGRRGAILLIFGMVSILRGVQTVVTSPGAVYVHSYIDDVMPRQNWAVVWIATGLMAMIYAVVPKRQQGQDLPGFWFALSVPLFWAACLLAQGVAQLNLTVALSSVVYLLWAGALSVAAGWPEARE